MHELVLVLVQSQAVELAEEKPTMHQHNTVIL